MTDHDTSDGWEEREAVGESLRNLSALSGWVAHEINNPLGGIQNSFALLRDLVPENHPHFKYVAAIDREIARGASLTQRLTRTYGVEQDRDIAVPISRYFADAQRALEPLRDARRVTVNVTIDPGIAGELFRCDLCRATVRHLVQHGIETASPDSMLNVRAWRDGECALVALPHFDAEKLNIKRATAGPPGLALQIVKRIVHALGGTFTIVAENNDAAELRVGLPLAAMERA